MRKFFFFKYKLHRAIMHNRRRMVLNCLSMKESDFKRAPQGALLVIAS